MYHEKWRKKARSRSAERARQRSLRGGRGGSLGEGRRVKQRTVEKWLPPDAGRRNIKGNRLLVREVKNRPSPGHTRIAFIHLLYVLYHWSVIPFWRAAPRGGRDTHGITQIPPINSQAGWHDFRNPSSFTPFCLYFVYFWMSFYDEILCIIYVTYRD